MERLAADTSFLIDLQRDHRKQGSSRGALVFLQLHGKSEILLPAIAKGEYLEGFDDPTSRTAQALVAPLRTLPVDDKVGEIYARISRELRSAGTLIGSNDLWIAATALAHDLPLLTGNAAHFQRVPGLQLIDYRPSP